MAKKRQPKPQPTSDAFTRLIASTLGVEAVMELKFHPTRRWRFDYAIPRLKIAIEIDGGVWIRGRHNSPKGYINDMEKFNEAAALGWVVLKFTPEQKFTRQTIDVIARTISERKIEQDEQDNKQ